MSWYWIVLLVIFYIVMWTITSTIFSRVFENSDEERMLVGLFWPLALLISPIFIIYIIVEKIVDIYGYREDK